MCFQNYWLWMHAYLELKILSMQWKRGLLELKVCHDFKDMPIAKNLLSVNFMNFLTEKITTNFFCTLKTQFGKTITWIDQSEKNK